MRFEIKKRYESTARLFNHVNADAMQTDQYVPYYEDMGIINIHVHVDAIVGRTYIASPTLLPTENVVPYVTDVRDNVGKPYISAGYMYKLGPAVPVLNAHGTVIHYKYNLLPVKK